MPDRSAFPLGAALTLEELERDPYPALARLRADEPVSWIPALGGWLVTRYDLALHVMRDPRTFTVDDARFSTGQVVGRSMLSLDGDAHGRHRRPFVAPFRAPAVEDRFADAVRTEAETLIQAFEPNGAAELRRAYAGPLAASIITRALGLDRGEVQSVLRWYDAIVSAVTAITAGADVPAAGRHAFAALAARLTEVIDAPAEASLLAAAAHGSPLRHDELVANAAVLLFGGIETTEGMIANALLHLLGDDHQLQRVRADPRLLGPAIEESLRLEPAAAVVDRYATSDTCLAGVRIAAGDLVRVSIAAANRDPAVFADPDRFDLTRSLKPARRHLAFAQGPHVCLGVHLARLEARTALAHVLARLPRLQLDPDRPTAVGGLVFRKPAALYVLWS